jgi:hypothetical protein
MVSACAARDLFSIGFVGINNCNINIRGYQQRETSSKVFCPESEEVKNNSYAIEDDL